jgi:hypothetical protein
VATPDEGRRRVRRFRLDDTTTHEVAAPRRATEKQIRRRGRWSLVLGTLIAAATFVSVAYADDIYNDLDASIDATAETLNLTFPGSNGSVGFAVQPANGDGKNGCNLTGASTLVVAVSSSITSVATVSPASITFSSCGDTPTITVTPQAAGSATVTLGQTSNDTGATFNLAPATFTVNVSAAPPSDTTPPVITPNVSGTLGNNGWYVSNVTVSWSVVDNESAISSSSGCGSTTTSADTDGTTLMCSATSAGGMASESVTIKRDATQPTLSPSVSPNPVVLNGSATASANAADATSPGSGLLSSSCDPVDTSSVGPHAVTCYAEDNAGNTNSATAQYTVSYGVCLLYDPNKAHKAGSTVPVRFSLCDANGVNVSGADVAVQATSLKKVDSTAVGQLEDSGSANSPDNNFRYDPSLDGGLGGYIFNLSTKAPSPALGQKNALTSGSWKLCFSVGGVGGYSVTFDVK